MSVERICSVFWDVETRLSLLSWKVAGIFPWPLLRMQIYYDLTQQVGLFDSPHPTFRSQAAAARAKVSADAAFEEAWKVQERKYWVWKLLSLPGKALSWTGAARILGWPKQKQPERDGLVIATRRVNGTEPYTQALRKELAAGALVLDRALDDKPVEGSLDLIAFEDLFRRRYRLRKPPELTPEDLRLCEAIREAFSKALGIDVGDIAPMCRSRVAGFLAQVKGFDMLFALNPVKTLFLTNAYSITATAALICARRHGAHIVELQHGFISPYHLGYSWPGRPDVPYKPDELWCFGDFWHETTPLPGQTRARVIGAPYVHELAKLGDGTRSENLVVFTSQGVIGKRLFEIALETARRRPDKEVIFRLHPSEALEDYEAALQAAGTKPANFALSHKNPNIFALLSKTAIQIGAFSTTLFEGMSLGCRTVVIDLPGCEYMRPAVQKGDVLFVRDVDELVAKLDEAPLAADSEYYYAKPAARLL